MRFVLELTWDGTPVNLFGPFKSQALAKVWAHYQGLPLNTYIHLDATEPPCPYWPSPVTEEVPA
jgi:hypothetical protein